MKFGKDLQGAIYKDWAPEYIDYKALKQLIKTELVASSSVDQCKTDFFKAYNGQLTKAWVTMLLFKQNLTGFSFVR